MKSQRDDRPLKEIGLELNRIRITSSELEDALSRLTCEVSPGLKLVPSGRIRKMLRYAETLESTTIFVLYTSG